MPTTNQLGMLKLTISPSRDAEYMRLVAEQIQQLPGVVRVRTTPATLQIEIIYRQPAAARESGDVADVTAGAVSDEAERARRGVGCGAAVVEGRGLQHQIGLPARYGRGHEVERPAIGGDAAGGEA